MQKKIAVIGAGPCGLASAKSLKDFGLRADVFELGGMIGGQWQYNNDNQRSAAYQSLRIDSSKKKMAFSDFPMPKNFPDYPHHSQMIEYFHAYANHFDLIPQIQFFSEVLRVEPLSEGGFQIEIRKKNSEIQKHPYDSVLICNGHHWKPKWAQFPGEFVGEKIHSHSYRVPQIFEGKRVVVIGVGNSGVDIACEATHFAKEVFLSTRRGTHVVPRYLFGKPTDTWNSSVTHFLPARLQEKAFELMIQLSRGHQEGFGLPKPAHSLTAQHPTMSDELLPLIKQKKIQMKPQIERMDQKTIYFGDQSQHEIDLIVYATGYEISFPFLSPEILSLKKNRVPLYKRVVHPKIPDLYFIGLLQPLGPLMPLAEQQARWVAQLIQGQKKLPSLEIMEQEIQDYWCSLDRRYVDSERHSLQVDFLPYLEEMKRL
jgi:cation diffusion facilitator CzcD-associated flavoprotein CzcO